MSDDQNNPSLLTQYLADRDEPCPGCDYNLRSLVGESCPECGQQLRLHAGVLNPNIGWVFAGLIGLAMGMGFNASALVYDMIAAVVFRVPLPVMDIVTFSLVLLFEGGITTIWLRKWRQITRCALTARIVLVAGCYFLTTANILAYMLVSLYW